MGRSVIATENSPTAQGATPLIPGPTGLNVHGQGPCDKLNLVTVSHFYPSHGGGLEKVAENLVGGLAQCGFRICWFSSDTDIPPNFGLQDVVTVPVSTSNIVERLTQLPYPLWSPLSLPRLWREIGNADIVHVHEHLYFSSIVAVAIATLRRRPVVITQHIGALGLGNKVSTFLYEAGARILGRIIFPLADQSVFISHNVQKFFARKLSQRTRLIFNGVDTHRFMPAPSDEGNAIRTRLGLPMDRRIILFVGRFVRKKGLHRVVALARLFPEETWLIVGSGPETPKEAGANVHVVGRVEHDQLPSYYRASDVLILPSSGEGLPLVVQEALCCGAAVLSTEEVAGACPEAADLIRSRPVPRGDDDIDGWASALREMLGAPNYLGEDARLARARRARDIWSWELCVSQYAQLLRDAARHR